MRVISGIKRGTKLAFVESASVRPTTDRVKESVFNIIAPYVRDAKVLDLFAGSGGLGIEALSRGAKHAVFVDHGRETFAVLHKNLEKTGFAEKSGCYLEDFVHYLSKTDICFDLIFLDPPYHRRMADKALSIIEKRNLLQAEGTVVLECDWDEDVEIPPSFSVTKRVKYGRVAITILKTKD